MTKEQFLAMCAKAYNEEIADVIPEDVTGVTVSLRVYLCVNIGKEDVIEVIGYA